VKNQAIKNLKIKKPTDLFDVRFLQSTHISVGFLTVKIYHKTKSRTQPEKRAERAA